MVYSKFKILLTLLMITNICLGMQKNKELDQYNSNNILGKFVTPIVGIQKIIFQYCQQWKLYKEFKGHTDDVIAISLSSDGIHIASSSMDNSIKIWEVRSGNCVHTLHGHDGFASSIEFSPNAKHIASASWDNQIKIWDVINGICVKTLLGKSNGNCSLTYAPNGKSIASIFNNNFIKICNTDENSKDFGECIKEIDNKTDDLYSLAYSRDGELLASGSWSKNIKIWNVDIKSENFGKCIKEFDDYGKKGIYSMSFSPCDKYLAAGCGDQTIKIRDITTGNLLVTIIVDFKYANSVSFSPCGKYLASAGEGNESAIIWDAKTGECIQSLENVDEKSDSYSIKYSKRGNFIVAGCNNESGKVKIWRNMAIDLLKNE